MKSVFFGEAITTVETGKAIAASRRITNPPVHAANVDEINEALHASSRSIIGPTPGTMVLVAIFLLAFVVYYFTNWKLLTFLWKVG